MARRPVTVTLSPAFTVDLVQPNCLTSCWTRNCPATQKRWSALRSDLPDAARVAARRPPLGGEPDVRDYGLLESALARPQVDSAAEELAVAGDYYGAYGRVAARGVALLRERPIELAIDRVRRRAVQSKYPYSITDIFGLDQQPLIAPGLVAIKGCALKVTYLKLHAA